MRNERGITMIALIIMIILMLVLVGTGIFTGIDAYKTMEAQTFIAQMKIIKEKIYVIREEYRSWDNYQGDNIYDYIKEEYSITTTNASGEQESVFSPKELSLYNIEIQEKFKANLEKTNIKNLDDTNLNNYFYFPAKDLEKAFGLSNLDVNVFINFQTGTFLSEEGVNATNFAGKTDTYYVLDELLDAQSGNFGGNVGNVVSVSKTELRVERVSLLTNNQTTTKVNIKLNKIFDKANTSTDTIAVINLEKPEVKTTITDKNKITIPDEDKYNIQLEIATSYVGRIAFEIKIGDEIVTTPGIEIEKVNDPTIVADTDIASQMKKVGWNSDFEEYVIPDDKIIDWYDYGINSKKWANILMPDGSYYVWIPRFAYYINDDKIDIKFLQGTTNVTFDGINIETDSRYSTKYNVPKAFTKFTDTTADLQYKYGQYKEELPGIWVSKYECTIEKQEDDELQYLIKSKPFMDITKNAELKYTSLLTYAREMVCFLDKYGFKNVTYPDGRITEVDEINLKTTNIPTGFPEIVGKIDTHIIKNSEWAALSYLSYSKYGANGNPVNSNLKYTSGEKNGVFNESSIETSSTANAYGVFDLTNNRPEFVAASASEVVIEGSLSINNSTPWITIYPDTFNSYKSDLNYGNGDGIQELIGEWIVTSKEEYFTIDSTAGKKEINKNVLTRGGKSLFDYQAVNYNETTKDGNIGARMVWIMDKD